ncbi:MAG: GerW family sporulation protein, partial [Candidatus Saccharibacteria bacterium]
DVNTVVGDAVETNDGTVIIPISQVSCGFAAGGGEYDMARQASSDSGLPFGGGSGGGVSVKPVGFLVVKSTDVRLISVNGNQLAERMVDLAPSILNRIENMMERRGSSPMGNGSIQ